MTRYDFMHAHPLVSLLIVDMVITGIYNIMQLFVAKKGFKR